MVVRFIAGFCFIILLAGRVNAQPAFNYQIYIPANLEKNVLASVEDMAYWMGKMSGKQYSIHQTAGKKEEGIQLQWVQESDLPNTQKQQLKQDGQTSYLEVNNANYALVVGTGSNSFINGIYTFLHELGFRWYMPGDAWTFVPKPNQKNLKIAKVCKPDFQNRSYFGTGGVNPVPEVDPGNSFKEDFNLWNRRNRFSTDFDTKGHRGQVFYKDNKKELDEHPEYSCNGKTNKYGRIDIKNVHAVRLYTNWALSQVDPKESYPSVGVDPADGSGGSDDCLPAGMPQIKNFSDKYFWLANQVAEEAANKKLNLFVQLYGYSTHAVPPGFKLHEKVYPIIIPYAFQREAEPADFIRQWSEKMEGRPMGIYDYWNITQWSKNVPQFNIYTIPEKLRLWKKYNINMVKLEATNAKGPMGHAFWLAGQMLWDTNQSFENLYNEFLKQCFGAAANDVRRLYDRWSLNYQGTMDVALSLEDLAKASSKTTDPFIQQRLSELKAYVHYLRLYYDYENKRTEKGYRALQDYLDLIHPMRLVQTSALKARYIVTPAGKAPAKVKLKKDEAKILKPGKPESGVTLAQQIERNFKTDIQENPFSYSISSFQYELAKIHQLKGAKKITGPTYLNGRNSYRFYLPDSRKVSFEAGSTSATRLEVKDAAGKTTFQKMIPASEKGYETVVMELPKGEYVLYFGEFYRFSRINFPPDISFLSSGRYYDNKGYPLLYVYVPADVKEIIYRDERGPGINKRGYWIDPTGARINPELLKFDVYKIMVPVSQRGKVWTLLMGHRSFELLNIPHQFSLTPFLYKND